MASTEFPTTGQAVALLDPFEAPDEALVGYVVADDDDSFDVRVADRGSSLHGETLTLFHSEIRSGGLLVLRVW